LLRAHIELDKRAVIAPVQHRTFGAFVFAERYIVAGAAGAVKG